MPGIPAHLAGRVRSWKNAGYEPYLVQLPAGEFVVRALTREEFRALVLEADPASYYKCAAPDGSAWLPKVLQVYGTSHYEDLLHAGLLWPTLESSMPAGVDLQLVSAIIQASGWTDPGRFLEELARARNKASTLWGFVESRIHSAFPHATPEKLGGMTIASFMDLAAMSEVTTGFEIDPRPWLDPEGYTKELEREQRRQRRAQGLPAEIQSSRDPKIREMLRKQQLIQLANETQVDLRSPGTKPDFARDNMMIASS